MGLTKLFDVILIDTRSGEIIFMVKEGLRRDRAELFAGGSNVVPWQRLEMVPCGHYQVGDRFELGDEEEE